MQRVIYSFERDGEPMIRGAIFDADGTLLDSMSIWDTIAEDYLRSFGIAPREDLTETFKTFSMYESACYYREVYGIPLSPEEIMDGIHKMIENFYFEKAMLKQGASDFLQGLKENGVKMCIATATDQTLIERALRRCGVLDYFSRIFTCEIVGKSKKNPQIFRVARDHLGTDKAYTWVFEDAFHAAETAKKDGFPVVAVFDRSEEQQDRLRKLANIYIKDFSELFPFDSGIFR